MRALERILSGLRRARADLRAGRPESAPADGAARPGHDAEVRALREVVRYEGTRAKTLAALSKAVEAQDEAKASEARAALETLDGSFVAALTRIETAARAATDAPGDGAAKAATPKAARTPGEGEKPSASKPNPERPNPEKPATKSRGPDSGATPPGKGKAPPSAPSRDGTMTSDGRDDDLGNDEPDDAFDDAFEEGLGDLFDPTGALGA